MNLFQLIKSIAPFVKPYRLLVIITLILTLIGSLMQQVNAIVLDKTVDAINALIGTDFTWSKAAHILTVISIVSKRYGQRHPDYLKIPKAFFL